MSQFVIVMGGSGSGKNYYIEHDPVLSNYELVDVDVLRATSKKNVSNTNSLLRATFETNIDVVHPMTGAGSTSAIENKLQLARRFGYKTSVILIETDPSVAQQNIASRVAQGGHGAGLEDWKIEMTNTGARTNFEKIKDNKELVDIAHVVQGRQAVSEHALLRKFIKNVILNTA